MSRTAGWAAADASPEPPVAASRKGQRGLDWFTFCVADVQTGFGPFLSVYLTARQWTQVDIGLILTAGGLAALAFQMPGGASSMPCGGNGGSPHSQ